MEIENEIFKFTDAVDYLNYQLERRKLKNNKYSARAWSRQLGYENPSYVCYVLKRQRKLKIQMANRFSQNLKLSGNAKRYFELLVLEQNCSSTEEKKIYWDLIEVLRAECRAGAAPLSVDYFRVIAEWYHLAILEMLALKDFQSDADYISKRLGGGVSAAQIKQAIDRLLKLKLVVKNKSGQLLRADQRSVVLENDIPNEAIQFFHKQMIEKAIVAVEKTPIAERDVRGSTFSLKKSDFIKATQILKKAHAEVLKLSVSNDGDEVYFLGSQIFKLTNQKELV